MSRNDNDDHAARQSIWRIGVVSFLNSRPLICGLDREPGVRLCFDVPSRLTQRLLAGEFDVALIPVIDLLQGQMPLEIVSNACIACNGETLTVRVFSKVPPEQIQRLHLDLDSRTSVALAKLIWPHLYRQNVEYVDMRPEHPLSACESVLLIGDKVVCVDSAHHRYQVDLGGAWKTWSGLPFVFAVWAAPRGKDCSQIGKLLNDACARGLKKLGQIAVEFGPALGWPASLAQRYLQHYLTFGLTESHVEGMVRFLDLARDNLPGLLEQEVQPVK